MIPELERLAKTCPDDRCFTFVEHDSTRYDVGYEELRLKAAALALLLQRKGIGPDSLVSVDMDNCPAFVVCAAAAAYGGFSLVALNHRLSDDEKASRLADLNMMRSVHIGAHLDERKVASLLGCIDFSERAKPRKRGFFGRTQRRANEEGPAEGPSLSCAEIIHFAERGAAFFDISARALVLFTSGTSGKPKAAALSWENLCGAARASNAVLNRTGQGLWQAALPLFHVGGFEVIMRSILDAAPFLLYRRFDPASILCDARIYGATHLSVVDKMLRDLLAVDDSDSLQCYAGILLGGAATNPLTLADAVAKGVRVFASYGMTETSSQIASSLVAEGYDGGLSLLPGYTAKIINPDERGFGQLAVKGPGIFSGYLNAPAAFTADGFFLTGDTAALEGGKLQVLERTSDMFVSGGENIYPAEIRDKLLRVPGVSDAYVFGVPDEVWGRRPVALVERAATPMPSAASPQSFALEVETSLEQRLSKLYRPQFIGVLDSFPRTGIGKIDRAGLRQIFDERIEVQTVNLYHIKQKFTVPVSTAKHTLRTRESAIIEVIDCHGRTGIGECVAFSTAWYLPETLEDDLRVLEKQLIPLVLQQSYLHPREVSACFDECEKADAFPLAKGALEPALWDLYGKIVQEPLWQLIREEAGEDRKPYLPSKGAYRESSSESDCSPSGMIAVPAGVVLGIMSEQKTLEAVKRAVESGCTRVKLKIEPGNDVARVRAVREAFPQVTIVLDANQSYTECDMDTLAAFDGLNIRCIEEPLDPRKPPRACSDDLFARLAHLQNEIATPICLDESIAAPGDLDRASAYSELRCYALKLAKWGGIGPALDFYKKARSQGIDLWMGGMYDTGVSKSLHAAFEALAGITIPGDLGSPSSYFASDICLPAFEPIDGMVVLNQPGYETGLGCVLDYDKLSAVLVEKRSYTKNAG